MPELSTLACGSYLSLCVQTSCYSGVFRQTEALQAGVWCYLNIIVLSWHIACSAEPWCAMSCCAMLNWATLWAKHKCEGVTNKFWTVATSSGCSETSLDMCVCACEWYIVCVYPCQSICAAVDTVFMSVFSSVRVACVWWVLEVTQKYAAHQLWSRPTLKERTSVIRQRWKGEKGRRGISKSSRCKNSLEGEKETSNKNNIKKRKGTDLEIKPTIPFFFPFVAACLTDTQMCMCLSVCLLVQTGLFPSSLYEWTA